MIFPLEITASGEKFVSCIVSSEEYYCLTHLFLVGVGRAVRIHVMYGGRGNGLCPPRRHVFGTGGQQSAGSILNGTQSKK